MRVGFGVGGAAVVSGSRGRPSHSCDGWVCDLGVVGDSSIFGLIRGVGAFVVVLPTLVLVSGIQIVERYRGFGHFLTVVSSSRLEVMVGGALVRTPVFRFDLGVSGATVLSSSFHHVFPSKRPWDFSFPIFDCPKSKIQGRMKLSPVDHLVDGILVLVPKDSNVKKEFFYWTGP